MAFTPPGPEEPAFGHDPHCVVQHPTHPDRLWQQNHCGVYRIDLAGDPAGQDPWVRVGRNLPTEVGDIGFPIVTHPREPDTAWVVPMDGTDVWPRTSPGGRPALYVTRDAGATWQRRDGGFPAEQAWWTVKRQALALLPGDPVGLALGTTGGQVWVSDDEGGHFTCVTTHLPEIYAVTAWAS